MKSYHNALSVCSYKKTVYALFETSEEGDRMLFIAKSSDGTTFTPLHKNPLYIGTAMSREKLEYLHDLKLSVNSDGYYLCYVKIPRTKRELVVAFSKDGKKFSPEKTGDLTLSGYIASDFVCEKSSVMYLGEKYITSATKKPKGLWNESGAIILSPRDGFFDHSPLRIVGVAPRDNGILLAYESSHREGEKFDLKIGLALLSNENPHHVLWRSDIPLHDKSYEYKSGSKTNPHIVGMAAFGDSIYIYHNHEGGLSSIRLPCTIHVRSKDRAMHGSILKRHDSNPILVPDPENTWEKEAVFNPGVLHDGENVHLLYRAIGSDGLSRVGYARSSDGKSIDLRHPHPVFEPSAGFGMPKKGEKKKRAPRKYCPAYYTSGGGWGGCEDPRVVEIEGRIYMTYVAFGGWDSMRMAVTSISKEDFIDNNWDWTKPTYLSPEGQMNKNWVIFPEKINGKFAILHSITPKILIDYVDDLDNMKPLKSKAPSGGREGYWDHKVRGAGPPPIRTSMGWLVLYHATSKHDSYRYKLGAMILDIGDPTKVLYRSSQFILAPDMDYENEGKPGVVYASGAIVKDENLYVYYGGGDRVVCVATIPMNTLLEKLKNHEEVKLEPTKAVVV